MNDRRQQHYTTEEIGHRGREIYKRHIRRKVEPVHWGKFIIDITTGEYVICENSRHARHKSRGSRSVQDRLSSLHHR